MPINEEFLSEFYLIDGCHIWAFKIIITAGYLISSSCIKLLQMDMKIIKGSSMRQNLLVF